MGLIATALVTVEEAAGFLKEAYAPGSPEYEVLEQLVNGCSRAIRHYLHRPVINESFTEDLDGSGRAHMWLPEYPIVTVTALEVITDAVRGTTVVLDPATDILIYPREGRLLLREGCELLVFPALARNVHVEWSAGLGAARANVSEDIRLACLKLVHFHWRTDVSSYSTTLTESGVVLRPEHWPGVVAALLDPFRKGPAV